LLREALSRGVEVEINKKTVTVDEGELIKQVAKGIAKGNIKFIELAFDRVDGKPNQPLSGNFNVNHLKDLTDEQLNELLTDGSDNAQ
jgi:hypothetical protein